ncbi:MAG: hypothetical protein KKD73_10390 [Proteobacteria bacterium]|nr:hypothetical protein [Pseudomonadota bacterium]MBU1639582.1 hypothetical protein [Pseudomonadota bacterium]
MIVTILDTITGGLDWLFTALVAPVFIGIAQGLDLLLLRPLTFLNIPIAWQTIIIAALAGCLSLGIRAVLNVEKKEGLFRERFVDKRTRQKNIELISDWKTRDAFYRTTDTDIDEDFNTYLAQRFARHTAAYLLPIFLTLYWLETALPREKLVELVGGPYAIPLPANGYGIEGLSVPFVFLVAYAMSLIGLFVARKYLTTKKASISLPS